ncbi:hypothetical protein G4Y79_04630 [Phototrophicus methaneseepsis]|uniref:non-reducing end alpha-L-arabinofuranosidase n=1 Tax=Phototrophicus methaneseepsis TaxID=2710758 RepID=A0A7S8EB10_9CHLR|nr:alpha-L-arabinofuranosidase C-terminal domain-containing protein [Phototrophicus methaneseepsis]QPC83673.1 hypothetical protein G4Y79_04630 [Phototrophicus methaneseepsis]
MTPLNARATIYHEKVLGRIDKKIYGQYMEFVEPDDKTVYGGVCDDEGNLLPDVIDALAEMGVPVVRFGGNFADVYRWQDGIGPKDQRRGQYNYYWGGQESNKFGTDEFLTLCEALGAESFININLGSAGLLDALSWLEYCNYDGDTYYTGLRKANGRQKPWNVPIWGIGNESWGNWEASYSTPEVYAERFNQFARYFKRLDPDAKLVAVGHTDQEWNEKVLAGLEVQPDYFSVHMYGHSIIGQPGNYEQLMAAPLKFDTEFTRVKEIIAQYVDYPLPIALDEWNVRHFRDNKLDRKSPRQVQDALFVAGIFHVMQSHTEAIQMANYVFMVNGHAPLLNSEAGITKTPLYDVFSLYQKLCHSQAIQYELVSPEFKLNKNLNMERVRHGTNLSSDDLDSLPHLDIRATKNTLGDQVTVSIINRSQTDDVTLALQLDPYIENAECTSVVQIKGDSPSDLTFTKSDDLTVNTNAESSSRTFDLAPLSVTFIELTLQSQA